MFLKRIKYSTVFLAVLMQYIFCNAAVAQYVEISMEILSKSNVRVVENRDQRVTEVEAGREVDRIEVTAMENMVLGVEIVPRFEADLINAFFNNRGSIKLSDAVKFKENRAVFPVNDNIKMNSKNGIRSVTHGVWIFVPGNETGLLIIEYH